MQKACVITQRRPGLIYPEFAEEIYSQQPTEHSPGVWNRVEYRPLEGFIYAVSPFNFTAIGGNLACAPALMGNVVIWKPSQSAMLSNFLVMQALLEAGLPPGVIQFTPGSPEEITDVCLSHKSFAGIHFTGSSAIFSKMWQRIGNSISNYATYPRIVGETGGKNMHFVHHSADPVNVVNQTLRAAFEYQGYFDDFISGQKCSACSRIYIPQSLWPQIKDGLIEGMKRVITMGPVEDFQHFVSAVISKQAFQRISGAISKAKVDPNCTLLAGGDVDDSVGWYISPTLFQVSSESSFLLEEELFGPVLAAIVYPDEQYHRFAQDRNAIVTALDRLGDAAGNFYINDKCTGAVVGQQPFGGARNSGTNDKAGSALNLLRWTSQRTIKENFVPLSDSFLYPSNCGQ
ncbi:hypothetical protein DI09_1p130 [Mitosporidium daphniae]|uniref:Aldehyde dehydrogenase domain-containing protein n=1 Tax=Mitosporidium daphniae TaxID=1485682 RepID=A0A098VSU3_9MICR|nr:uncharacterized protein DI09_1p130 [Mitosporidium daphniae]KGG52163.1 hypothetical protein DI09_1p130 [Mitosporidium daphniae]|eukprot:XP_013238590.1 uncharacterized protein DI09_1p130 [Mitosporidium daphniae]